MESKILSIIIPVHNTSRLDLEDCFKPFIEYTDRRLEVVVIDDGSEDQVFAILNDLCSSIKVSHILIRRKCGGPNSAREVGLHVSHGKYIYFVDSDDRIDWLGLVNVINYLDDNNPDILLVNTWVEKNKKIVSSYSYTEFIEKKYPREKLIESIGAWWRQIQKRELFLYLNDKLFCDIRLGEDLSCIVCIDLFATTIHAVPYYLYIHKINQRSITGSLDASRCKDILKAFNHINSSISLTTSPYYYSVEQLAVRHILFHGISNLINTTSCSPRDVEMFYSYMSDHFPFWKSRVPYYNKDINGKLSFRLIISGHWFIYKCLLFFYKNFGVKNV